MDINYQSWYNRTLSGYEAECMLRVNTLISRLVSPLSEEHMVGVLKELIPDYMLVPALEYALDQQNAKRFGNAESTVMVATRTSAK